MGTREKTTERSAWALLPFPWIAAFGATLMIVGAVVPFRYFPVRAGEPGPGQTLIDIGASGGSWSFVIASLPILTFLGLAGLHDPPREGIGEGYFSSAVPSTSAGRPLPPSGLISTRRGLRSSGFGIRTSSTPASNSALTAWGSLGA
jgi:hypothetical protein